MSYTTTTIMQLKRGFGKFRKITEKIKIMVCKWKGPFRVKNPLFLETYKVNKIYLKIFLFTHL